MAALNGYEGQVKLGTNIIAIVSSWSITDEASLEETNRMQVGHPGYKEFSKTLPEWSGSFSGYVSATSGEQAPFKGSGSTQPALTAGATIAAAEFTNSLGTYKGDIVIESLEITTEVDGFVEFSVDFQGTGLLTKPGMGGT